jgi:hypothetical protein
VLNALRLPRNRPYLHTLVFVLLVSWVSALVSSTCAMPAPWRVASEVMPAGCAEPANHAQAHQGHTSAPAQDCSFKPCLDSQPNLGLGFKIAKLEIPVFLLCLIWMIGHISLSVTTRRNPRITSPPDGRRIPLIYRFCTLLN